MPLPLVELVDDYLVLQYDKQTLLIEREHMVDRRRMAMLTLHEVTDVSSVPNVHQNSKGPVTTGEHSIDYAINVVLFWLATFIGVLVVKSLVDRVAVENVTDILVTNKAPA